eukprot:51858_1
MAASPAYPALQQQEQAPPPVAFDQSTPSVAVIHEPQETQDGENYRDTPQRLGQVVGGGESSEQQQIMVYVEQQNNGYSYHSVGNKNNIHTYTHTNKTRNTFVFLQTVKIPKS